MPVWHILSGKYMPALSQQSSAQSPPQPAVCPRNQNMSLFHVKPGFAPLVKMNRQRSESANSLAPHFILTACATLLDDLFDLAQRIAKQGIPHQQVQISIQQEEMILVGF